MVEIGNGHFQGADNKSALFIWDLKAIFKNQSAFGLRVWFSGTMVLTRNVNKDLG